VSSLERAAAGPGVELIEREAVLLDEQRWDAWLALYTPDCEFWMPAWKADGTLTTDPQRELSHIYYGSRAGLEERILRIRSGRSAASTPIPRTTHLVGQIFATAPPSADLLQLRSSWMCSVFFPRSGESQVFFGRAEHRLVLRDGHWLIARKKTVLLNDVLPTMFDVYCV
jgi:3-phenylpropionate/cinnamic acid dioxygenase small subunit